MSSMKLTTSQADLSAALATVRSAVQSGRPSHPILATVLLTATPGTLSLAGFDLKTSISTTIAAEVAVEGAAAVPYALLAPLVAKLPAQAAVTIAASGERIVLATVSGEYSLTALDAADWPELTEPKATNAVTVPLVELQAAITATAHAASRDEAKQILQGIKITLAADGIQAAATDGHRLSLYGAAFDASAITVPAATLRELQHLRDSVTITSDAATIRIADARTAIVTRILDGTYPNVQALVPETYGTTIAVDRLALLHAVQRVGILADTHNSVVKLAIDDNLTISADVELGNGSETLAIEHTGKAVTLAVNAAYLQDGLRAMTTPQVTICANAATTPFVIRPVGADTLQTYLIMPVQVRT